jgi:putative DNA primase/helicase
MSASAQERFDATATPPLSEDELALQFADRHKDQLRFVPKWGRWFVWNDMVWVEDQLLTVFSLVRTICREIAAPLREKGKSLASNHTVAAVERLARCDQKSPPE